MNIPEVSFGIAPDENNEVVLTYIMNLGKKEEEVSNSEVISLMALVASSHLHHMAPSHEHFLTAAEVFKYHFNDYIAIAEQHEKEQ